eukprot:7543419-Lingulodinium_polyedra.AAC.1
MGRPGGGRPGLFAGVVPRGGGRAPSYQLLVFFVLLARWSPGNGSLGPAGHGGGLGVGARAFLFSEGGGQECGQPRI